MMKTEAENHLQSEQLRRSPDLWFRLSKKDDLENHRLHQTIRLGNRQFGTSDPKGGYSVGDVVELKIQKEDSSFDPWKTRIVITGTKLIKLDEMTNEDFSGSSESREELEKYYGGLNEQQEATMIDFEYLEDAKSAKDLLRMGLLKRAELPAANPPDLGAAKYTLPLINHDYPAKTPIMWNAAYDDFELAERNFMAVGNESHVREILSVLRDDPNYCGGGAGVGFKDESFAYMDELDPLAREIGSINFILRKREGKLKGYNTDGLGYALSLEQIFEARADQLEGKQVVVLGAGGTANSIVFALASKGARVMILNRSVGKAEILAHRVNKYFGSELAIAGGEDMISSHAKTADVIVNVSTKGAAGALEPYSALAPATLPATPENIARNASESDQILQSVRKDVIVSDINLVSGQTRLLNAAEHQGLTTLDGIPMVINQAVEAFWILYGETLTVKDVSKADVARVMAAAAKR